MSRARWKHTAGIVHHSNLYNKCDSQAEEHEKKLRHIVEDIPIKIKNQSGSSAGAGSSEFYIYRNVRATSYDMSVIEQCMQRCSCLGLIVYHFLYLSLLTDASLPSCEH
jgi:hypothetical protein